MSNYIIDLIHADHVRRNPDLYTRRERLYAKHRRHYTAWAPTGYLITVLNRWMRINRITIVRRGDQTVMDAAQRLLARHPCRGPSATVVREHASVSTDGFLRWIDGEAYVYDGPPPDPDMPYPEHGNTCIVCGKTHYEYCFFGRSGCRLWAGELTCRRKKCVAWAVAVFTQRKYNTLKPRKLLEMAMEHPEHRAWLPRLCFLICAGLYAARMSNPTLLEAKRWEQHKYQEHLNRWKEQVKECGTSYSTN